MSPVSRGRKRKPGRKRHVSPGAWRLPEAGRTGYVDDLSPLVSEAEVQRALERRRFVMPSSRATIDGEELDWLDPADPDERALLIKGEHPELQDVDTTSAGFSPRFHLTIHEVIANQLWDDDPPEVWQAAQRLRDQGLDRHDVLHRLMDVMVRHMQPVMADKSPFDTDAYRRDLDALGRQDG